MVYFYILGGLVLFLLVLCFLAFIFVSAINLGTAWKPMPTTQADKKSEHNGNE